MKRVTQNLWISIAICVFCLFLAVIPTLALIGLDGGMEIVGGFFDEIWENGEVDTVEGHGAILVGFLGVLGILGEFILIGLLFAIGFYIAASLFFTLIARFVYAPQKGWRLVVYRVLMTVLYLVQALAVWFAFVFSGFEGIASKLIFIPIGLFMAAGIIYSAINTYSDRILK